MWCPHSQFRSFPGQWMLISDQRLHKESSAERHLTPTTTTTIFTSKMTILANLAKGNFLKIEQVCDNRISNFYTLFILNSLPNFLKSLALLQGGD